MFPIVLDFQVDVRTKTAGFSLDDRRSDHLVAFFMPWSTALYACVPMFAEILLVLFSFVLRFARSVNEPNGSRTESTFSFKK